MVSTRFDDAASAVVVTWPDGVVGTFPFIWLRDNCPTSFHRETEERTFDLLSVPLKVHAASATLTEDDLLVVWTDGGHESRFALEWLRAHRPGARACDPAAIEPALWRADLGADALPKAHADALEDDDALLAWLCEAKRYGLALIDGLEAEESGFDVARRIGFLRRTNFGETFDVVSKPDPNNLAYTPLALPLHTDLTNQETPPGFQFLHCLANEAIGGGSLFCDGFAIAEDIRRDDPLSYGKLSNTLVPMRFHDADYDIRNRERVIRLDEDGRPAEIRFNAHLAGVFDLPAAEMTDYYRAYRAFMAATREPRYQITLKLKAGQMVVFDNRRILHGREAFDPTKGVRRLRGCYVDRGEWDSRIRVLSRAKGREA
ncbi:MAG: TauD/TfdA family dioxygenase [Pseudomonadota bacterium]